MGMLPSDMLMDEGNNNKILTGTVFNQEIPHPPPLTLAHHQLPMAPQPHPHLSQHPHHGGHQVVPTGSSPQHVLQQVWALTQFFPVYLI